MAASYAAFSRPSSTTWPGKVSLCATPMRQEPHARRMHEHDNSPGGRGSAWVPEIVRLDVAVELVSANGELGFGRLCVARRGRPSTD